jgi:hypothetical protein
VREAGRRVITADFKVVHHHSLDLVSNTDPWIDAHMRIAEKWEHRMPGIGLPIWGSAPEDWKHRARRAEAEAGATRLERESMRLQAEARERQLRAELEEVVHSTSWRVTKPLRKLMLAVRRWSPANGLRRRT